MAKEVTHAEISISTINGTLDYLSRQPFREVSDIIFTLKREADESFAKQQHEGESNG